MSARRSGSSQGMGGPPIRTSFTPSCFTRRIPASSTAPVAKYGPALESSNAILGTRDNSDTSRYFTAQSRIAPMRKEEAQVAVPISFSSFLRDTLYFSKESPKQIFAGHTESAIFSCVPGVPSGQSRRIPNFWRLEPVGANPCLAGISRRGKACPYSHRKDAIPALRSNLEIQRKPGWSMCRESLAERVHRVGCTNDGFQHPRKCSRIRLRRRLWLSATLIRLNRSALWLRFEPAALPSIESGTNPSPL